ncbi:oxidoreductase, short-chain dehydrogenase reductase family protein [Fructilactobacillus fructivorans]|uniref:SDR family oxidoreductase n=1 Tax=Fructilactobacillus fructivorans TaxID=1614 RepID=UPI000704E9D9|nr:SDR family oxidoreductase [Fructilactobacillus fructivorans]KRN13093.1 oxidoreductase, short-chain dehydrogenase reductase family protein [Fructilactobacillus fructivorans]
MAVKNKVVVITGASSGIGEATAKMLAKNGAKVVLGARREDRLRAIQEDIEAAGGVVAIQKTDVTKLDEVRNLASMAVDQFGRIDVWMNNAGVMPQSPLINGDVKGWNQMIDVNIKGVLYGINASLDTMRAQGDGQYINTASVAAHTSGINSGVYSATKAAVKMISDSLREEEAQAKSGIRVTMISPGAVATELPNHITDPDIKKKFESSDLTPLSPDRIAQSILYAIDMPKDASVNEIVIRPTDQV